MKIASAEFRRPFDLAKDLMIRASLVAITEEEHALIIVIHHIAADGWSLGVLSDEVARFYQAYSTGQELPRGQLPIQYADYAHWCRRHLEGAALESEVSYWKQQLSPPLPVIELPTDRLRRATMSHLGKRALFSLSGEPLAAIRRFTSAENVTLFVTLLTAFKILLLRYTGEQDIVVGTASAGRFRPELEQLIGLFINNLVLRTDLSGEPTVRELLARVRETALNAFSHERVPLDHLAQVVRPHRDGNHSPLFQVMFVLQKRPMQTVELPGLKMSPVEFDPGTSRFDLSVDAIEMENELRLYFEYNTHLFDSSTIERMQEHYALLLDAMVAAPESRIGKLPMLTSAEHAALSREEGATCVPYPRDLRMDDWIERQAAQTPDAIAVSCGEQQLTYRELSQRSDRLARRLRALGVGSDSLVGLCLDRSLDLVVAPLAVWKAGGVYVPLDPEYPGLRLAFMLEDAAIQVLVTESRLLGNLPGDIGNVLCLDRDVDWQAEPEQRPAPVGTAEKSGLRDLHLGFDGKAQGRRDRAPVAHEPVVVHAAGTRPDGFRPAAGGDHAVVRYCWPGAVSAAGQRRTGGDCAAQRQSGWRGTGPAARRSRHYRDAGYAGDVASAARIGLAGPFESQNAVRRRSLERRTGGKITGQRSGIVECVWADRNHHLVYAAPCGPARRSGAHFVIPFRTRRSTLWTNTASRCRRGLPGNCTWAGTVWRGVICIGRN